MTPFSTRAGVRRAVSAAIAAPSVHNTQPWRFLRYDEDGEPTVGLYADIGRSLPVIDPLGRALGISCGAALFNLRMAVRRTGHDPQVSLLPDPEGLPDLLAEIGSVEGAPPTVSERVLYSMIPHRRTNRFPFQNRKVPAEAIADMVMAAREEGATLVILTGRAAWRILALVALADGVLAESPGYRAELMRWTGGDESWVDGVPHYAFGPRPKDGRMPLRDFALGCGHPHLAARFERDPFVGALLTERDDMRSWLTAGQAMQRVLLTATAHGLSASMFSQPLDLREVLPGRGGPGPMGSLQMILRFGYGPQVPRVPRRPVGDVLHVL